MQESDVRPMLGNGRDVGLLGTLFEICSLPKSYLEVCRGPETTFAQESPILLLQ